MRLYFPTAANGMQTCKPKTESKYLYTDAYAQVSPPD